MPDPHFDEAMLKSMMSVVLDEEEISVKIMPYTEG